MLYQHDAEMLFPPRVIPSLRNLRGREWQQLVEQISLLPENAPDVLAFALMMIRLNACMSCHSDSFRAMRGCTACAQQIVARFKGSDRELIERWQSARGDIVAYFSTGSAPQVD